MRFGLGGPKGNQKHKGAVRTRVYVGLPKIVDAGGDAVDLMIE